MRPIQHALSDDFAEEYARLQSLFSAQPESIQSYLAAQGERIAEALSAGRSQVRFTLPNRIIASPGNPGEATVLAVPEKVRQQSVGSFMNPLGKRDLLRRMCDSLSHLERSPDRAVSSASGLLRYAAAMHIVYKRLPAGVTPATDLEDHSEAMAFIPGGYAADRDPGVSVATRAVAVGVKTKEQRKGLFVPFAPYARKFLLPQWVAFDQNGELLVASMVDADASVAAMQNFMEALSMAVTLAPYISADEQYARQHCGITDQLIDQGRSLASYRTTEIITILKARAASNRLNRGLSLSLPYFNDQALRVDLRKIEVIPAGLVQFVPAFVVIAMRREAAQVAQDKHLNTSTRQHLLNLLGRIGQAFETS